MFAYLKSDISNKIIFLEKELPTDAYVIGSTYDDYINNMWIKLTEEQINFYKENENASPKEIIEMVIMDENINLIRQMKLNEIDDYDKSNNVNSFLLNGINVWVDRETRVSLMSTTKIKQELGINETTIWSENLHVTLPCNMVINMLSTLEIYAYDCFNKTAEHKLKVNELQSVEEIKQYDITTGYPEKLSFNLE